MIYIVKHRKFMRNTIRNQIMYVQFMQTELHNTITIVYFLVNAFKNLHKQLFIDENSSC